MEKISRRAKLWTAGLLAAGALAVAAPGAADAHPISADSDGYVPVYSTCAPGNWVGNYYWYNDGYATYGTITINDCALQRLGAGPNDRQRVLDHEWGHAIGLPHSSDPSDLMYPVMYVTGT